MTKQDAVELAEVIGFNTTTFATITFTDLEFTMKVVMFIVTLGFTIDKWIAHRKKQNKNG